jgi:hypothetical protein
MKTAEIIPALKAGNKLAIGEYRGFETRVLPDGKNIIISEFVLVGRESMPVERFAPKGYTLDQAKGLDPKIKLGTAVVVAIDEWGKSKYGPQARGTVTILEA